MFDHIKKKNKANPKLLLKKESTYLQTQFTVNSQNDATLTKKKIMI